jgi:peptidyl-dipeptidase Dcp
MAELRAEKAKLLGYPTWAAYALANQGAKTPENAIKLLTDLVPPATARAHTEAADMQKLIDSQGGGFKLQPWDWQYYAEQVRKARYDLDEAQIMPYFELNNVLQNGVFYAANKLYGLTFKERHDIPVYHPDVRTFEVFDADGSSLALIYFDYFKRDNKSGGAWMDQFVDQSRLTGWKPVVYNVANFTKPAPGQPALLTFDDVTTMFHEFGHGLHGMFSRVQYPTLSGTNVPRDFVEFPSQFNEHWALEPSVFANYAKNYQTVDPAGVGGQDQAVGHVQSGVHVHRAAGRLAPRLRLAHASAGRRAERCRFIRGSVSEEVQRGGAGSSASLPKHVLLAHLGRRLLCRLLRLHLE